MTMLNKSKLIIAAALLAVGSSAMGAAALMGSSAASAQDIVLTHGNATEHAYRENGKPDRVTYEIQKWGLLGF
jgi:hypothetical protein